jgi:hypothetical protein
MHAEESEKIITLTRAWFEGAESPVTDVPLLLEMQNSKW